MGNAGLVRESSSQSKQNFMPKLSMLSRCLTKCHRHLGISWSGQIFQSGVSLDESEGGEVSLPNVETC